VEQAQLDELWTFVRKKEKMLSAWEKLHTEWGDILRLAVVHLRSPEDAQAWLSGFARPMVRE
ncbi:MAG: hypothetical protein ACE5LU_25635, partial [Anaerolineae bacterium]